MLEFFDTILHDPVVFIGLPTDSLLPTLLPEVLSIGYRVMQRAGLPGEPVIDT